VAATIAAANLITLQAKHERAVSKQLDIRRQGGHVTTTTCFEDLMAAEKIEGDWRDIVGAALDWGQAHATLEDAVKDLSPELRGRRPEWLAHSPWELLEHLRLAQSDLADFMEKPDYTAPEWPADYWPSSPLPPTSAAWDDCLIAIRADTERIRRITLRPSLDLASRIPWGDGQTYLRTVLVAMLHSSYHVAQIIDARRALGAWKK
jgi:hypothetical protein